MTFDMILLAELYQFLIGLNRLKMWSLKDFSAVHGIKDSVTIYDDCAIHTHQLNK